MEAEGNAADMKLCFEEKTTEDEENVSKVEPEAAEGGWGWLIVFAIAVNRFAVWGVLPFFSIIFMDVVTLTPGAEGSAVTFLIGLFFLFVEITGILFPAINRKYSLRVTGTAGGIIFAVGTIASIFVNTLTELAISYGFIQGVGYGLTLSSSMTAFNEHFRRRRTTAMAAAQFSSSVLALGLPHAVQAAREAGGARGGRLVMVGLGLASALTQLFVRNARPRAPPAGEEGGGKLEPLVAAPLHVKVCKEVNGEIDNEEENEHHKQNRGRARRWARVLLRLLGLDERALRAPRVWGPALGVAVCFVGVTSFFALLPLHLSVAGLSKGQVTDAVAAANLGDAAARLALVVLGFWLGERNRLLFAGSALISALCLLVLAWQTSWTAALALSVVLGAARGVLYVALLLSLAEVVAPHIFPAAMALYFLSVIFASVVLAPLIGLVRDLTGSYPSCFCFVAALLALYPVAWGVHAGATGLRRRRQRCHRPTPETPVDSNSGMLQKKDGNSQ